MAGRAVTARRDSDDVADATLAHRLLAALALAGAACGSMPASSVDDAGTTPPTPCDVRAFNVASNGLAASVRVDANRALWLLETNGTLSRTTPDGTTLWSRELPGGATHSGLALLASGDAVAVVAVSEATVFEGAPLPRGVAIVRVGSDGAVRWTRAMDGIAAAAIERRGENDAWLLTIAYDGGQTHLWQVESDGSTHRTRDLDIALAPTDPRRQVAFARGPNGHVVAQIGLRIVALDAEGRERWSAHGGGREVHSIAVDAEGRVAVGGAFELTLNLVGEPATAVNFDGFVAVRNADGTASWQQVFQGDGFEYVYAVGFLATGDVIAGGHFGEGGGAELPLAIGGTPTVVAHGNDRDLFVARLDRDGALMWAESVDAPRDDAVRLLEVHGGHCVTATGFSGARISLGGTSVGNDEATRGFVWTFDANR